MEILALKSIPLIVSELKKKNKEIKAEEAISQLERILPDVQLNRSEIMKCFNSKIVENEKEQRKKQLQDVLKCLQSMVNNSENIEDMPIKDFTQFIKSIQFNDAKLNQTLLQEWEDNNQDNATDKENMVNACHDENIIGSDDKSTESDKLENINGDANLSTKYQDSGEKKVQNEKKELESSSVHKDISNEATKKISATKRLYSDITEIVDESAPIDTETSSAAYSTNADSVGSTSLEKPRKRGRPPKHTKVEEVQNEENSVEGSTLHPKVDESDESDKGKQKKKKQQKTIEEQKLLNQYLAEEGIFVRNTRNMSKKHKIDHADQLSIHIPSTQISSSIDTSTSPISTPTLSSPASANSSSTTVMGANDGMRVGGRKRKVSRKSTQKISPIEGDSEHTEMPSPSIGTAESISVKKEMPSPSSSSQAPQSSTQEIMKYVLERIRRNKNSWFFKEPTKPEEAPGFDKIVKIPLDLAAISKKVHNGEITSVCELWRHLTLMFNNSQMYNSPDTDYHKWASELREFTRGKIRDALEKEATSLNQDIPTVIKTLLFPKEKEL